MKSTDVRSKFLQYFESHDHRIVESSRLIPDNDPTLLFINAGMNQFKNTFLGLESRDYKRATSSQKCVRAGGKHNDLENVGFTARHHTFFEMLGNFSFGDYFKKEAIHYAWDFVTKDIGLDKDRLYVSVFEDDDEAAEIWQKQEGVPKDRIYRFGEKDNFWRMGNTGPCGPCSEIFYDLGPDVPGDPKDNVMGGEGDRYIEFWNLVFMQYNEDEKGNKTPLPAPSVDTGCGLERLSTILQGKTSNYDNDLFQTLIQRTENISGLEYIRDMKNVKENEKHQLELRNVAMRVLADHARAAAFLIGDGVLPSNEGRGYVLRRIMRRAIRYGRNLSTDTSFLPKVVEAVIEEMGGFYTDLRQQSSLILETTKDEEQRFFQTLDKGTEMLEQELSKMHKTGKKVLDGKFAFKLYDTFGFPIDLTSLMVKEKGLEIDEASFDKHWQDARELAKASWKGKALTGDEAHSIQFSANIAQQKGATNFTGYNQQTTGTSQVVGLSTGAIEAQKLTVDQTGILALDQTCFYAESGGQVGDTGIIRGPKGVAEVLDTTKKNNIHLHHIKVTDGVIQINEQVQLQVDEKNRRNIMNNHSATHLMHAALRKVLGEHVTQAGSLVTAEKLRFDFTHKKPLSREEIENIEDLVNNEISKAIIVETNVMSPKAAQEAGALALFGEKYGDEVRVLKMGDFSMELCGGTHVDNTASIRLFKIVNEAGVSSGVRRIEAITGDMVAKYAMKNIRENLEARANANMTEKWQTYLESNQSLSDWIESAKQEKKNLQKKAQSAKGNQVDVKSLVQSAEGIQHGQLVFAQVDVDDRKLLSELADQARDLVKSGAVVLIGQGDKSLPIVVNVSKDLAGKDIHAGKLLGTVAEAMGGKGGGRPDFAQGAGKDASKVSAAKQAALDFLN